MDQSKYLQLVYRLHEKITGAATTLALPLRFAAGITLALPTGAGVMAGSAREVIPIVPLLCGTPPT